jgi:hypothetical protein
MGREIRRVPKGWVHPQKESTYHNDYGKMVDKPMYKTSYRSALKEWIDENSLWEKGEHPDQKDPEIMGKYKDFAEWRDNPPNIEYYNTYYDPENNAVATHYQIYETVSEGTPQSPVFETMDEMEKWLISEGHSEKAAKGFCKAGNAPSMIMGPGFIKSGIDVYDIP